ncbi:uncharacterized protein LOC110989571 [Acanthaster planci]|uniref:Uncharacterized protein LOC110989571 n=1 Tax=Acanthaster planci TaxID=133434 RepID=A0A8B8A1M9_ACAPL|nr:uncharacterized protein LOC110989571 [Acanthaster planci]
MDQSRGADRCNGRQQRAKRSQLREILDDLDRQDRALLRVSHDLLDAIAALKEAHELSVKHSRSGSWTSSMVRGESAGNAGTGSTGATPEVGSAEVWTCSTETSS